MLAAVPEQLYAIAAVDTTLALVHSLDMDSRGMLCKRPVDSGRKAAWTFSCTTKLVKVRIDNKRSASVMQAQTSLGQQCSHADEGLLVEMTTQVFARMFLTACALRGLRHD